MLVICMLAFTYFYVTVFPASTAMVPAFLVFAYLRPLIEQPSVRDGKLTLVISICRRSPDPFHSWD